MTVRGRYITMRGGNVIGTPPPPVTSQLLLDLYPMKVGFSLRKLRTLYGGAVIKVRRTLDDLESDIPFDGLYMDINFLLNFCQGSSGFVTRIYNQGTSPNSAYQTSSSSQFMIVNNGVLNLDGIYAAFNLDGFDWMTFPNVLDGGETSIFSVSRNNVSNSFGCIFSSTLSSVRFSQVNDRRSQKRHSYIQSTSGVLFAANLNSHQSQGDKRYLSTFIDSSKNLSSYYNGVFQSSVQYSGDYIRDSNRIGRDFFGYLNGNIQELLIDTNDWSADRVAIETHQSDFYGS